MNSRFMLLSILILVLGAFSASAELPTRVNISMSEVVYNNITFAKDFYLEESNPFCEIHGTMNITNPGDETVFDTYISFKNVERLITDFIHVDGRDGSMHSGGSQSTHEYGAVSNTTNDVTLAQDLDKDTRTDYMHVNGTRLYFNLSSKEELLYINLTDGDGNIVDISSASADPVEIEVINATLKDENKSYANITIMGTTDQDNQLTEDMDIIITDFYETPVVIHIPELRENDYTTFIYNVTCEKADPPVTIETDYHSNSTDYPDINRKVLAGYNWTITQKARNDLYLGLDITNINISIQTMSVEWNESVFNFSLQELLPRGDYENVHGNGTSDSNWFWTPNGGNLSPGEEVNISYNVMAPHSVPFTATYMAIKEQISYDAPFLMSNLTIVDVNASAKLNQSVEKRIHSPADDELNKNVTWEARPKVTVPANISYQLNKVSLWVTTGQDPNRDSAGYTGLNRTYSGSPIAELNMSHAWQTDSSNHWHFNFTDGSEPPIVWMEPEWLITNKYGQIKNYSRTVDGKDLYMKYIYVIHGYWLQVNKNITSIGDDNYKIFTYVENIGTGWTPRYEYVAVYDFVPNEFDAYNFSVTSNMLNQSVGTVDSDYYGTSYRWNIPWKEGMNASLGPKNGPDATGPGNYSWNVSYYVNGTGDYRVTELYIVGLDPFKVDGATASPMISVISGLQTHSKEAIYVGIVAFLIIVNVANLIMSSNINKKIDNTSKKN